MAVNDTEVPVRLYTRAELEEAAMLAAGAASGVFLRADPELVMPSTEVEQAAQSVIDGFDADHPTAEELCQRAWVLIANAQGGNWEQAPRDWQQAAMAWRDEYFDLLNRSRHHTGERT